MIIIEIRFAVIKRDHDVVNLLRVDDSLASPIFEYLRLNVSRYLYIV